MPSVTSCTLQRVQPASSWDNLFRGTFTLKYDIKTDGLLGHKAVMNGATSASPHALPSFGATYSYQGDTDSAAFAQSFSCEPKFDEKSQVHYVATVVFSPLPDDQDDGVSEFPIPWQR